MADNSQRLQLLKHVADHPNLNDWEKFVKAVGEKNLSGAQVKRIKNNAGNVPGEFYERLIAFCRERNLSFAEAISERQTTLTNDESSPGWAGFLATLDLTNDEGKRPRKGLQAAISTESWARTKRLQFSIVI